jgi:hypothetical protein
MCNGVQIIWCSICKCAVCWSLMTNAESPRTLFDLLYCFFPEQKMRVAYDNECNFLSYALNRAPAWTSNAHVYIESLYKKGHVKCADRLDTGAVFKRTLVAVSGCGGSASCSIICFASAYARTCVCTAAGLVRCVLQSGLVKSNQSEPPFELRINAGSDKRIVPRKGFNFINLYIYYLL